MRMMLHIKFPTERFNAMVKDGTVGPRIKAILEDIKPEAAYFGEDAGGVRGAVVVVDIPSADHLSKVSEPWFLSFNATVETHVAMTPEDLGKLGLDELAKKYA